jgi:hypothetical protein
MTFTGKDSGRGTLRVYIDGAPEPVVEDTPFNVLSGRALAGPPLADSVSPDTPYENRGHDLYLPIPYAKHCKITYESARLGEWRSANERLGRGTETVYYSINHRAYAAGTPVVSFSKAELQKNAALINGIQRQLAAGAFKAAPEKTAVKLDTDLAPGESRRFTLRGPAAIQRLAMKIEAAGNAQALRSTVLEIAFDGEKTVAAPAGDFFGVGYRQAFTRTWFTAADEGGLMEAFWVMPFARTCEITLRNLGARPVRVAGASASAKAWDWDARSMHFGASWRQYTRVPAMPDAEARDLNFVTLEGRGIYVGDSLTLFNTGYRWWGEGDEKVYVDGEKFPSHFGTGSEDYYGYAWSRPEVFTGHPFIAQPVGNGAGEPGLVVNTRLRSLDGIPFRKSLRFDMELWSHSRARINFAPAAYWYALPGARAVAPAAADMTAAALPVPLRHADLPPVPDENGNIEGEHLCRLSTPSGRFTQQTRELPWSGNAQLFWQEAGVGSVATLGFDSDKAGRFTMTGVFTIAPDYAMVNIYLNGRRVLNRLDLSEKKLGVREVSTPEPVELRKGANVLEVEIVRRSKFVPARSFFGLDRLSFK